MVVAVWSVLGRRRRIQSILAAVVLLLVIAKLDTLSRDSNSSFYRLLWQKPGHDRSRPPLVLPSEYDEFLEPAVTQPEYCSERFTPRYLDDFRTHGIQYCATGSPSSLHCFHGRTRANNEVDSICIGQGATLDVVGQRFALDCEVRRPDENETSHGLIPFDSMRKEWYETGPRWIFDHWVKLGRGSSDAEPTSTPRPTTSPQFVLLVKRECHKNIWHCLMEIWSMTMTFDLLRTTPDPSRGGAPYFADRPDLPNTQAIILDDLPEGNRDLMELWSIFTGRAPLHLKDLVADPEQARVFAETQRNIIVPLAGAANPLWQNDWVDHECAHAPLLKTFVHRVLRFYGIPTTNMQDKTRPETAAATLSDVDAPGGSTPINLTFIDRTGSRKLLNQDALLAAAAAKHPHVRIQSIDFSTLSFRDQLQLARETDVLVGVHGAGLTHAMFMRDWRGAVVEIQPMTNDYRGFKNLAFMKGSRYFTAFAEQVSSGGGEEGKRGVEMSRRELKEAEMHGGLAKRDSWHWDDVRIELDVFMELVDAAVAAVSQPGQGI
jgi:protein O-GlcNAc transferase